MSGGINVGVPGGDTQIGHDAQFPARPELVVGQILAGNSCGATTTAIGPGNHKSVLRQYNVRR